MGKNPITLLTDSAQKGELIIIVGTGVSMALTYGADLKLSWKGLIEDGLAYAEKKGKITEAQVKVYKDLLNSSDIDDLLSVTQFIGRKLDAPDGVFYTRWLKDTFEDVQPSNIEMAKAIKAIYRLKIPLCTLNYDSLLEKVTGLEPINYTETERDKVFAWMRPGGANTGILHLHGLWSDPASCILTSYDYNKALSDDVRDLIQKHLASIRRLLFIGCGDTFADPNFSQLIKWLKEKIKTAALPHYALVKADEVSNRHADPAWQGFVEPISYGASHTELPSFLLERLLTPISSSRKKRRSLKSPLSTSSGYAKLIEDYRIFILNDCGKMTIEGVRADIDTAQRKFDLERLFVPIKVLPCRPGFSEPDPEYDEKMRTWKEKNREPLPFGQIFTKHKRLALLALPGGGKTLLLKRLAVAYADPSRRQDSNDQLPKLNLIPVVIRCREWREYIRLPILTLLRNIPDITGQVNLKGLDRALIQIFKNGQALILVDGLDEIHDDASRSIFVEHLEKFLDEYKLTRLIVTSREAGFDLVAPCLSRFCERWNIAPLEEAEIILLCNHWQNFMVGGAPDAFADSNELAQHIIRNGALHRLAENPLLLTMLLVVKHCAGQLPPDRVSLYGRAVEILLDTWNIKGHDALNSKEAIPQLASIAFQLMRVGKQTATEKELLDLLEKARDKVTQIRRYAKDTPYEFLKRVELRSSLLIVAGHQTEAGRIVPFYQFRHLTFQEYLAAVAAAEGHYLEYTTNDNILTPLSSCLTSEEWKEVVPMAAVLARKQAEPLMAALVKEGKELYNRLKLKENFIGKKEWLSYNAVLPAPVARLVQCIEEEAEATPDTLTEALQLVAIFARGCRSTYDWRAICHGPYADELLLQMWILYEPMQWPAETNLFFTYGQFVLYRYPSGYWNSSDGQAELQRLLNSQRKDEIAIGLFACAGLTFRRKKDQFLLELIPLDQIERLLFHDNSAICGAASYTFAVIASHLKQLPPLSPKILDRLLMLWLNSDCELANEPISVFFYNHVNIPRQEWKPVLSDVQVKRVRQLAESPLKLNFPYYVLGACIIVAFYARNVWPEDELVNRIVNLKKSFRNLNNRNSNIIHNMLKQIGKMGRK